jgi:dihydropteroate synthase
MTAPPPPPPTRIGPRLFEWGSRTYVMGIVNVTPDSFSGDGLLAPSRADAGAASRPPSRRPGAWSSEGADILDVGGESTRPGHEPVSGGRGSRPRRAGHRRDPRRAAGRIPISVDTSKAEVAAAALDAGATLLNDVWGVGRDDAMARLAGERHVPLVVMHNREAARTPTSWPSSWPTCAPRSIGPESSASRAQNLIVDPGFGFGKTPEHNLRSCATWPSCASWAPVLLGTSRKSTLGRVLGGVPPEERLEATLATTALGIAAGVDIVRVHDVLANVRAARMSDAIVRGPSRDRPDRRSRTWSSTAATA